MAVDLFVVLLFVVCSGILYGAYLGFRRKKQVALEAQYDRLLELMISMESHLFNIEKSIEVGEYHRNYEHYKRQHS